MTHNETLDWFDAVADCFWEAESRAEAWFYSMWIDELVEEAMANRFPWSSRDI